MALKVSYLFVCCEDADAAMLVFWGKGSCSPRFLSQTGVHDFQVMNSPRLPYSCFFAGWLLWVVILFLNKAKLPIWFKASFLSLLLFSVFSGGYKRDAWCQQVVMTIKVGFLQCWRRFSRVISYPFAPHAAESTFGKVLWSMCLLLDPETKGCQVPGAQATGGHPMKACGAAAGGRWDTCFEMAPDSLWNLSLLCYTK